MTAAVLNGYIQHQTFDQSDLLKIIPIQIRAKRSSFRIKSSSAWRRL